MVMKKDEMSKLREEKGVKLRAGDKIKETRGAGPGEAPKNEVMSKLA
jgi:hypothetical protein